MTDGPVPPLLRELASDLARMLFSWLVPVLVALGLLPHVHVARFLPAAGAAGSFAATLWWTWRKARARRRLQVDLLNARPPNPPATYRTVIR